MSFGNAHGSMIRKIKNPEDFISMVKENNYTAILPMLHLLKEVNRIHRNGLDID